MVSILIKICQILSKFSWMILQISKHIGKYMKIHIHLQKSMMMHKAENEQHFFSKRESICRGPHADAERLRVAEPRVRRRRVAAGWSAGFKERGGSARSRGRWLDVQHRHTARSGKLYRARSRLYRSQSLQADMRWKALAEIYTMHSFAQLKNLIFCVKKMPFFMQNFAKFLQN